VLALFDGFPFLYYILYSFIKFSTKLDLLDLIYPLSLFNDVFKLLLLEFTLELESLNDWIFDDFIIRL
jgi:hypothetical protein